jgi:hypothetical protein
MMGSIGLKKTSQTSELISRDGIRDDKYPIMRTMAIEKLNG